MWYDPNILLTKGNQDNLHVYAFSSLEGFNTTRCKIYIYNATHLEERKIENKSVKHEMLVCAFCDVDICISYFTAKGSLTFLSRQAVWFSLVWCLTCSATPCTGVCPVSTHESENETAFILTSTQRTERDLKGPTPCLNTGMQLLSLFQPSLPQQQFWHNLYSEIMNAPEIPPIYSGAEQHTS